MIVLEPSSDNNCKSARVVEDGSLTSSAYIKNRPSGDQSGNVCVLWELTRRSVEPAVVTFCTNKFGGEPAFRYAIRRLSGDHASPEVFAPSNVRRFGTSRS